MKASWKSVIRDIVYYCRIRLCDWRVAALWGSLVVLLLVQAPRLSFSELACIAVFLAAATALLRLWDDLADVEYDRAHHPDRVLFTSGNKRAFVALLVAGLAVLWLTLADEPGGFTGFGILLLFLALLYYSRVAKGLPRPVRASLVLVKYPALLTIAGATPSGSTWLIGLMLYVTLGFFEWHDDRELRRAPFPQILLGGLLGLLIISTFNLPGIGIP